MNEKKLEYVKLIFYEDKKNYDNSWGEVYYTLVYGDNQVHRTYKQRVNKSDYFKCLKAFRLQEGTNSLPYEKHQIFDARTKKPLNMPYYLKKKTPVEEISEKVKKGIQKTGDIIESGKEKVKSLMDVKDDADKSILNSIRGGINDIRGSGRKVVPYSRKQDAKKILVRLTSVATTTVLLATLGNYELKKHKMDFSDMIFINKMSNSNNYLDKDLRMNYIRFEDIMNNILSNKKGVLDVDDLDFLNNYIYNLSRASNDSKSEGNFYEFEYSKYLDKNSPDYRFFLNNDLDYKTILMNDVYKKERSYEYCAVGCNLLYYTVSALSMNKSNYMPRKDDIYSFNQMSSLSKIVFLNQLKGVIVATKFTYKKGDEPYWWIGLRMDTLSLINKIDSLLEICNDDLKGKLSINIKAR